MDGEGPCKGEEPSGEILIRENSHCDNKLAEGNAHMVSPSQNIVSSSLSTRNYPEPEEAKSAPNGVHNRRLTSITYAHFLSTRHPDTSILANMASRLFGAADPASRASEGKRLQHGETCQICALEFVAHVGGLCRWKICIVGYDWDGKGKVCERTVWRRLVRECTFLHEGHTASRSSSLIFEASRDWEIAVAVAE